VSLSTIRNKIRALIEDLSQADFEAFSYRGVAVFTLSEPNITTISEVTKNSVALGSGDYSYDSTFNEITITASLSDGDVVKVEYLYNKYSDTELNGFITASLVYINIYSENNFKYDEASISPTPTDKDSDLISLVSCILIRPNYLEYKLPNVMVKYPEKYSKTEKIKQIVNTYKYSGEGVTDVITYTKADDCYYGNL